MSNWPSHKISVNGITLHYHRTGGDLPPLVLAHGITDSSLAWSRLAKALQDSFDMIMLVARGHGDSDKPQTGYDASDHAADVAGLIEALGLGQPALIGHSMGARTVAALAVEYPQQVKRIVLEDPPWRDEETAPGDRATHFQELIARYHTMSRDEIVAFGRQNNPTWDEEELALWARGKAMVSAHVAQFSTAQMSWRDSVAKIACPTLLVTGDPAVGAIVTPETAEAVCQANAQIQVVRIPGAGHNIRRDQFAAYSEAVKAFLLAS